MAVSRNLASNGGWSTALTVQAQCFCDRTLTLIGVRMRSTAIHSPLCDQRWTTFSADARAETLLQGHLPLCEVWLVLEVKDGLCDSWSNPTEATQLPIKYRRFVPPAKHKHTRCPSSVKPVA